MRLSNLYCHFIRAGVAVQGGFLFSKLVIYGDSAMRSQFNVEYSFVVLYLLICLYLHIFDGISAFMIWAQVSLTTPGLVTETFSSIFMRIRQGVILWICIAYQCFQALKNH